MKIPVAPVPKPRMTRSDRWKKRPAVLRYWDFCDALRQHYTDTVPDRVVLTFHIPMPASWAKKKKASMMNMPHQQKPDIDNYVKAFLDALCEDDSYVYGIKAEKYWSTEGFIEVDSY